MKVLIQAKGTTLGERDRRTLTKKIRARLARFATRVKSVRMRVRDENGPKGGVDHRCTLEARVRGAGRIRVEARDEQPHSAVSAAAHKLTRRVRREIHRRRGPRPRRLLADLTPE